MQPEQDSIPNVAVVAVHGVGDPGPDRTGQTIADLLTEFVGGDGHDGRDQDGGPAYQPFEDRRLHLPTRPLGVDRATDQVARPSPSFHAISQDVAAPRPAVHGTGGGGAAASAAVPCARTAGRVDTGHTFMQTALEGPAAAGPGDVYSTLRRDSRRMKRVGGDLRPAADVKLFELYWADLSRPGRGLRALGELYQILFHVCRLGRHAVDAAALDHADDRRWSWYGWLQSAAVQLFTVPIAVVNMLLAAAALGVLLYAPVLKLPAEARAPAVAGAWGVVLLVVAGWWLVGRNRVSKPLFWVPPIVAVLWLAAVPLALMKFVPGFRYGPPGAAIAYGLAGAVAALVIEAYNRPIPGSRCFAACAGAVLAAKLAVECIGYSGTPHAPISAGLHTIEWCLTALWLCWALFVALCWLAALAGHLAAGKGRTPRDRRVQWTARLTLGVSAGGFTLATLGLWAALAAVGSKLLPGDMPYEPSRVSALLQRPREAFPLRDVADYFLDTKLNYAFCAVLVCSVAALVLAAWGLGPVAYNELRPPCHANGTRRVALGGWLEKAFGLMRVSGELLYLAVALFYPAVMLWLIAWNLRHPAPERPEARARPGSPCS